MPIRLLAAAVVTASITELLQRLNDVKADQAGMDNVLRLFLQGATQAGGAQEGIPRPATDLTGSLSSKVRSTGVCMGPEQQLPLPEPYSPV